MAESTIRAEGMRGHPRGEPFPFARGGDGLDALEHDTTGHGPCPDEELAAIHVDALAAEHGCDLVRQNPRRSWAMAQVHLLRSPDEVSWVMQTSTDHVAQDLTDVDPPSLGVHA